MIIKVGEEKVDHVMIVMSGECFVETEVVLDYYKLTDGRFLLDLPSSARPDISKLSELPFCRRCKAFLQYGC